MGEWDASGNPIRRQLGVDGGALDVGTDNIVDGSITAADLGTNSVTTVKVLAGSITKAKLAMFMSAELTGTGAAQNIAHGLGVIPSAVLITPTDLTPATAGVYSVVEGAHTSTNVIATVTTGKKFKVQAWV